MGFSNSYALLMPVPAPLPIVSIKIGYNSREKHKCNKRVYSETVKARQKERAIEHV